VACWLVLPFARGTGSQWGSPGCASLDFALLYVMLALGLNIVVGYAGLLDLGYIAFYAVGAYLMALLASPHFAAAPAGWMHPAHLGGLPAPCSPACSACCSARRR
jgi:branched-chain amino acid transport system permease protein